MGFHMDIKTIVLPILTSPYYHSPAESTLCKNKIPNFSTLKFCDDLKTIVLICVLGRCYDNHPCFMLGKHMLKNDPGFAGVGIAKAFNKQTNKHGYYRAGYQN